MRTSAATRACAVAVALALVAPLVTPAPVAAATTRTVDLQSRPSAFAADASLLGVLPGYLLVRDADDDVTAVPRTGDTTPIDLAESDELLGHGGTTVWLDTPEHDARTYRDLASGATGDLPDAWQVATADGGAYLQPADDGDVAVRVGTYDGGDQQIAVLPAAQASGATLLAGPGGLLVVDVAYGADGTPATNAEYVPYADPNAVVDLAVPPDTALRCDSVAADAAACYDSDAAMLVRLPLDGSAAVVTDDVDAGTVAVTGDLTVWTDYDDDELHAVDATGAAAPDLAGGVAVADPIAADGGLYWYQDGPTSTAGVYGTGPDGTAPTRLWTPPADALHPNAVTVAAGQAVWSDDSTTGLPVSRRTLSTANGLSAAAPRTLGETGGASPDTPFAVSGTRIAWTSPAPSGTGLVLHLSDVTGRRATLPQRVAGTPQLSGTRVLYTGVGAVAGHRLLYNLVTHRTVDLTKTYGAREAALAGDFAGFAKPDGTIWRVNLAARGAKPVKLLSRPSRGQAQRTDVFAYGDYVAWFRYESTGRRSAGFRNARTLAKPVVLDRGLVVLGVSTGGVVQRNLVLDDAPVSVRPWTSGRPVRLPATYFDQTPTVHGSLVGYVDVYRRARVTQLSTHLPARPRALGNATHPSSVKRGGTWALDLVASAAPTSCSVAFRTASGLAMTTVRCDATALRFGEIRASWDGRVKGKRAPAGRYGWTVRARNADGVLVHESGSAAVTGGTLTITE